MPLTPSVVLALSLLTGAAEATESLPLPECRESHLRVDIRAESASQLPVVCISPGQLTGLVFDAPLASGAVQLHGAESSVVMAHQGPLVSLLPSESASPGERMKVTVHHGDGAALSSTTLVLVVHPARAHQKVEFFRHRRTVDAYQQESREKTAALEKCEEDRARLRAAQGTPDGLTGLLHAGILDDHGIASLKLSLGFTERPGSALAVERAETFRASKRVALRLVLRPPSSGAPWMAREAVLLGPGGRKGPLLRLWQQAPLTPGGKEAFILLEGEASIEEAQGPFTLKLWEAGGQRTIILDGVRFPDL